MRMVASDLDGTIVRPDGTISTRTLLALDACEQAGVDVVFVTGRPPRWMAPIAEVTGHRGVAICGNGAAVVDLATDRIIDTNPLTHDAVRRIVLALRAELPGAAFSLETTSGYRQEAGFLPHTAVTWRGLVSRPETPSGTVDELLADDPVVLKVLCRLTGARADEMLAAARRVIHDLAEPVHSDSTDCLLEMSARGVSKASALTRLAAERGIDPVDVVAFGDMPNDVPLLRWAGRGYAMADGHPEAVAAADELAPGCLEDGVAQVLERLLAGEAELRVP
ncbi:MAG: HAD family phosphatase [Actinomycetales bacterium]|nr:HAD family phosphatase [Actinomycetales bacterium]